MKINVINQCNEENHGPFIQKILKKAYKMMGVKKKLALNVILVTNDYMRELNKTYRGRDAVTDVLTFPSELKDELGDVFIALHVAYEQSRGYGHTFKRELGFLVVHGFLHALGYDHDSEEKEHVMFNLQEKILNKMKLYR